MTLKIRVIRYPTTRLGIQVQFLGLFPAIAAWGATVVPGTFRLAGGRTLQAVLSENLAAEASGFLIHGMIIMERGYIFTCMILAAVSAFLIDRRYSAAAAWSAVG